MGKHASDTPGFNPRNTPGYKAKHGTTGTDGGNSSKPGTTYGGKSRLQNWLSRKDGK